MITLAIPINRGVSQGCPISMTIVCLTIDFLLRTFIDPPSNLTIDSHQFTILTYTDDLVLFGSSKQDIKSKINEVINIVDKIHLKCKPAKCGYFTSGDPAEIRIYGELIPTVDSNNVYTYFGVPFGTPKGHIIKEILDNNIKDFITISESKLHPSQITSAYKTFIQSRLHFHLLCYLWNDILFL